MELHIQLAQAVHVLNHDIQSCNRIAANQWLVQFQQTDAAWEIATSVLTSDHHHLFSSEVEFFSAQILKRKIEHEGHILHLAAKDALLNALLLAAKRFCSGPPQLLTQICLAISTLVLHAVEHQKPVEHLFYNLQNLQSHDNGNTAVLEMLTVLPEIMEDQNSNCHVTSARRYEYEQELLAHTPLVLEFLMKQFEEGFDSHVQPHDKISKLLRCLLSWVRAGCFLEIPPVSLPAHPLLNFVFSSLKVASSFDLAVEVLIELVSRHEGLPQVLLCRIGFLKEALLFPAIKSGNEKVIAGLACLMSEIGQAAPFFIADASTEALSLADAILSCVAFPSEDWDIADSTLQFWCSFAGYILGLEEDNAENRKNLKDLFVPIFSALVDSLILRVQVDDSTYKDKGKTFDLPNGLEQFRMNLVELLVEICQLFGSALFIQKAQTQYYAILLISGMLLVAYISSSSHLLCASLFIFLGSWINSLMDICWKEVEAKLFMLNAVADVVLKEGHHFDITITMQLVMILSNKTAAELRGFMCLVYKSLADVIGSYAKLMSASQSNMRPLILFFGAGIPQPSCSSACAYAFRKLCEEAAVMMHEPSNLEILIWIGEVLEDRRLPLEDEDEVVGAITLIFCSVPDEKLMNDLFARLVSPSYEIIGKFIDEDHGRAMRQNPSAYIESINSVGRCLHRSEIWGTIAEASVIVEEFGGKEEYGPLFISTFEQFTSSNSVMALTSSYICDQEPDLVEAYTNFASAYVRSCPKEVLAASGSLFELSLQKAGICCTALHRGAALSAMSYMTYFKRYLFMSFVGFLEVGLGFLVNPEASTFVRAVQDMVIRIVSVSGEGLVSNLVYALLGVSAMSRVKTRVQKATTILQQLAAMCSLSEGTRWKAALCWEILHRWLYSAVSLPLLLPAPTPNSVAIIILLSLLRSLQLQMLPPEYLKSGEVESLVPIWLKALVAAAADYGRCGEISCKHEHMMQGKGGRVLKRLLREFADNHRNIPFLTL
ncbi:hypothetical protein OROGR_022439 [Orobanche gracilis]